MMTIKIHTVDGRIHHIVDTEEGLSRRFVWASPGWMLDGSLVSNCEGPAVIFENEDERYYLNGLSVSKDLFEAKYKSFKYEENEIICYRNASGILHRMDGPAIIHPDGNYEYAENGLNHRTDGPAFISKGVKRWYFRGKQHRSDGLPAVEYADGRKEYWENGKHIMTLEKDSGVKSENTAQNMADNSFVNIKIHTIDGKIHNIMETRSGVLGRVLNSTGKGWEYCSSKVSNCEGPAVVCENGNEEYFVNGTIIDKDRFEKEFKSIKSESGGSGTIYYKNIKGNYHREDGPAEIYKDGLKVWWRDGKLHRSGGLPAIEGLTGYCEYWEDGRWHRTDGPAIIRSNGDKFWYFKGNPHRDGGLPACEYADGRKSYWENGKHIKTLEKDGSARWAAATPEVRPAKTITAILPDGGSRVEETTIKYRNANESLHKEDGPAVEKGDGEKEYWINGSCITEALFKKYFNIKKIAMGNGHQWVNETGALHNPIGPAAFSEEYKGWYMFGDLHRTDGPACERSDGSKEYWIKGNQISEEEFNKHYGYKPEFAGNWISLMKGSQYYSYNEPSCVNADESCFSWIVDGLYARDPNDGPALKNKDYEAYYKLNSNILHRENGPAVIHADGTEEYWKNGSIHRTDGPAVIDRNGKRYKYFIEGREMSEDEFFGKTKTLNIEFTGSKPGKFSIQIPKEHIDDTYNNKLTENIINKPEIMSFINGFICEVPSRVGDTVYIELVSIDNKIKSLPNTNDLKQIKPDNSDSWTWPLASLALVAALSGKKALVGKKEEKEEVVYETVG